MSEAKQTIVAKVSAPKAKPSHPPAIDMVKSAILAAKSRKGLSLSLIKKYLIDTHKIDIEKYGPFLRRSIVAGVEKGILVRMGNSKGSSGSFKLAPADKVSKKETIDEAKPKLVKKVETKEKKAKTTKEAIKKVEPKKAAVKKVVSKKVEKKVAEKPVKLATKSSPVKAKKAAVTKAKINKVVKTVTKPSPKKVVPKKTVKKAVEKK